MPSSKNTWTWYPREPGESLKRKVADSLGCRLVLKRKVDKRKLHKKVKDIGAAISMEDFIRFLKKKWESTKSSPSGCHMGHYKVFVMDEEVSSLLTAMINIGLQCGVSLKLWQNIINIMVEKERGNPKLHWLWIIQLFQADFNFCLKTIFGKRWMRSTKNTVD